MSAGTSRNSFGEDLGESLHVFWQRGLVCRHGLAVPLADYIKECFIRVCPSSHSGSSLTCCFPLGLVKAINTAVDLIVAHFGTSRDPGVKVCLAFNILSDTESNGARLPLHSLPVKNSRVSNKGRSTKNKSNKGDDTPCSR